MVDFRENRFVSPSLEFSTCKCLGMTAGHMHTCARARTHAHINRLETNTRVHSLQVFSSATIGWKLAGNYQNSLVAVF